MTTKTVEEMGRELGENFCPSVFGDRVLCPVDGIGVCFGCWLKYGSESEIRQRYAEMEGGGGE